MRFTSGYLPPGSIISDPNMGTGSLTWVGAAGTSEPPCGDRCPGDCGWNPDDPTDPCATPADLLRAPETEGDDRG